MLEHDHEISINVIRPSEQRRYRKRKDEGKKINKYFPGIIPISMVLWDGNRCLLLLEQQQAHGLISLDKIIRLGKMPCESVGAK